MTTPAMTEDEAYRFGFLLRCARAGVGPDGAHALAAKAAGWGDLASSAAGYAVPLGLGTAAAATMGLPMAAGYGVGKAVDGMTEPDITPEDVRRRELISAYDGYAARAESKTRRLQAIAARPLPRVYGA